MDKMRKLGKKAEYNWVIALVIGALLVLGLVWYFQGKIEKQKPHPADMSKDDSGGTPSVRLIDEEGNTGEMEEDFYKVTGVVGAMVTGETPIDCPDGMTSTCNTTDCQQDSFCSKHIKCRKATNNCVYSNVKGIGIDVAASNLGDNVLNVSYDSASDTAGGNAFSASQPVGDSKILQPGDSKDFIQGCSVYSDCGSTYGICGDDGLCYFDMDAYKTVEGLITYEASLSAVDQFTGDTYSGNPSVTLQVFSSPEGNFSVSISQFSQIQG